MIPVFEPLLPDRLTPAERRIAITMFRTGEYCGLTAKWINPGLVVIVGYNRVKQHVNHLYIVTPPAVYPDISQQIRMGAEFAGNLLVQMGGKAPDISDVLTWPVRVGVVRITRNGELEPLYPGEYEARAWIT